MPVYSTIISDAKSLDFKKHADSPARLYHRYRIMENISLLSCCWFCNDSEERCMAVNFNEKTNICELNDKNVYFSDHDMTSEDNWDVYNVVYGKETLHYVICLFCCVEA